MSWFCPSLSRSRLFVIAAGLGLLAPAAFAADPPAPTVAKVVQIEDFAPPTEFITAGGVKTHYITAGEPTGRPVILIHGFGSCTHTWRMNIPAMAKAGYRVYALDIKGFGLTAKPRNTVYDLPAFTQHVLDFMDAMKVERAILVGNSMGGAISMRVALTRPERVAGVVLVDAAPPGFDINSAPSRLLKNDKGEASEKAKPEAIAALKGRFGVALAKSLITPKTIERGLKSAYHDPKLVTPELVEIYYRPFTIDGAVEAFLAMTSKSDKDYAKLPPVSTLKAPALIVWGRHDTVIPVSMADWFAKELPNAKKVILEKSGHMPHEEEADAFNALFAEFAASTTTTPK